MIAGVELTAWLSDSGLQELSDEAQQAFMARLSASPLTSGLRREFSELHEPSLETVRAAVERAFSETDGIERAVREMVEAAAADPFFKPRLPDTVSDIHGGLVVFQNSSVVISLGVSSVEALAAKKTATRGPTSVGFTGAVTVYKFLKTGGATLSFWNAPEITVDFSGDTSGTCHMTERRRLEDGEIFVMDGRSETFVIEHATSDLVFLQAAIAIDSAPLSVEYDSRTLAFVGANSTDEAASRIQMMATLLREMDRVDAVPVIVEALNSPHFYTRWHLMRELLALDAEAALPHLIAMADADPHPEVRATAKRTLDALFPDRGIDERENAQCRA